MVLFNIKNFFKFFLSLSSHQICGLFLLFFFFFFPFVVRCLRVYDVYLLCEFYLLLLKTFIFVSLKKIIKNTDFWMKRNGHPLVQASGFLLPG